MTTEQRIEAAKEHQRKSKAAGTAFFNRLMAGDIDAINSELRDQLYTKKGNLRQRGCNDQYVAVLLEMKLGATFDEAMAKVLNPNP